MNILKRVVQYWDLDFQRWPIPCKQTQVRSESLGRRFAVLMIKNWNVADPQWIFLSRLSDRICTGRNAPPDEIIIRGGVSDQSENFRMNINFLEVDPRILFILVHRYFVRIASWDTYNWIWTPPNRWRNYLWPALGYSKGFAKDSSSIKLLLLKCIATVETTEVW